MNSIPETSPSPWPITRVGIKIAIWGVLAGLAVRGSHYAFTNHSPPAPLAILMILATAGLMFVCTGYLCRWLLALDEMQQRIQLLSLGFVGPGMLLGVLLAEMLRWAKILDPITWNVRSLGTVFLASYCVALAWFSWKNR
jgi:prepilin signal peptidase PulO-like enzyme (type II secretory pathway)